MSDSYRYDPLYRKKLSESTHKAWLRGVYNFKIKPLDIRSCKNPKCTITFSVHPSDHQQYCSHSCFYVTGRRPKILRNCLDCNKSLKARAFKYCSTSCQQSYLYKNFICKWKAGEVSGVIGISTKGISGYIRRYLCKKYHNRCSICGWNKKHPVTSQVPLEVDHMDGNWENNSEENLRLICPNCHALTPNFRNLNKGKGRGWRLTYIYNRIN